MSGHCYSCDDFVMCPVDVLDPICDKCRRDPETNNCSECGKHLEGIPYPYTCGDCARKAIGRALPK